MDFEDPDIIINVVRPNSNLNAVDLYVLRETVRMALDYDPTDQSFRLN